MSIVGDSVQAEAKTAVPLGPGSWEPGSEPDPLIQGEPGLIGAPVSRLDGVLKVTGGAPFAADVQIDGMVYASLAFSTIAKGRLATLDTSAAEEAPGVVLVMTYRNAPRMKPTPLFMSSGRAAGGDDLPVMQDDRIHWNGQPIAVVLASTQEEADHARSLIQATYEIEESATSFEQVRSQAGPASFGGAPLRDERGDAEAALAAAPFSVDLDYRTPYQNHNAIEPHAATVAWDGDELTVHDATQGVTHMAWSLADIFGLDEGQVHVTSPFVGGAFGGKTLWQHHVLGAAASKLAGRPVRIALSREGVYRVVGGRTATEQRVAIGADADGRFKALIQTGTVARTPHNGLPEAFILPARCLYAAENVRLDVQVVELDMLANTFVRARRARRSAASPWSARSTSSRSGSGSILSSSGSATSPTGIPLSAQGLLRRDTWSRHFAWEPSGSDGPTATRGPANGARASGSPGWAVPPRRIRITGSPAALRG